MTQIPKGANLPVPASGPLQVAVCWRTGPGLPDIDVSALLLDGGGLVRGDADLVFYNQRVHPSGAVRHMGKSDPAGETAADWLWIDLSRVEASVNRVVVAASCDGGTFGRVPELDMRVADATGASVAYFPVVDATTETAFVFGEFYRRADGWRFRAVGQGYATGLAGLATDFGIRVERTPPPPPAPAPAPPGYAAPGYAAPEAGHPDPGYAPTGYAGHTPPAAGRADAPAGHPGPAGPHGALQAAGPPYERTFRPFVHQGRGKETVRCDPAIPPGWVLVEIESRNSISTTIESCDEYGRGVDFLLTAYEDDVQARTVALVPRDRPLGLRVEADTPWTLRVLPLAHARRFSDRIEGVAHDLVVYEGPAGVLDFFHSGESNFTVHQHRPPQEPEYDEEDQDLLVNEIGDTRVSAPVPGPGLLRIAGDGPWKCAVRG
ncbi:TerD family protein [Streptomyces sp. SP18CS02]|uniref:TerD family protein n=1 Tax=Streptomyces sp. SP18CS02 TaxID=3002531 RepID=UPI002E77FAE0|nr:TerD family protein [Streptomyces sp. SP18CS02]MEE1753648.1 TerD family protein [Streptomyces sp. SP18CS02]